MAVYRTRKEDLENQLNKGALWAVTYGDLMSYLMIFFLVLFSFSVSKTDKTKSRKYEESLSNIQKVFGGSESKDRIEKAINMEKQEQVANQLKMSFEDKELKGLAQVEQNEKRIKLVLSEAILFDSGKAELKETAKNALIPIIEQLKQIPNEIIIEGHTDNMPIKKGYYATNWELSMARAYSVIKFMEEQGIPSTRLAGIGYGEHRPLTDNTTPESRARNRRIEISLMKIE